MGTYRADLLMRLIGYCRVSTAEQSDNGHGLDGQEAAIRAHVERTDSTLVELYRESGSGRTTARRPMLAEALERIEAGEADGLIVAKLDRLSRSTIDAGRIIARADERDWTLLALDFNLDTSTAAGRLVANVMMAVAQWEVEAISERTKAGLKAARAKGIRPGPKRQLSDATLSELHRLRASGMTYRAIANDLNQRGITRAHGGEWSYGAVSDTINRFPRACDGPYPFEICECYRCTEARALDSASPALPDTTASNRKD